jgi:hypothetical protein
MVNAVRSQTKSRDFPKKECRMGESWVTQRLCTAHSPMILVTRLSRQANKHNPTLAKLGGTTVTQVACQYSIGDGDADGVQ